MKNSFKVPLCWVTCIQFGGFWHVPCNKRQVSSSISEELLLRTFNTRGKREWNVQDVKAECTQKNTTISFVPLKPGNAALAARSLTPPFFPTGLAVITSSLDKRPYLKITKTGRKQKFPACFLCFRRERTTIGYVQRSAGRLSLKVSIKRFVVSKPGTGSEAISQCLGTGAELFSQLCQPFCLSPAT